jgi:hypothetical protein
MGTFLEDIVLPELIKDKDKLENEIISLRKDLDEIPKTKKNILRKLITAEDYRIISKFVKDNSGCKEYFKDRKGLLAWYKPKLEFMGDKLALKVFFQEPTILPNKRSRAADGSFYYGNIEEDRFEIWLGKTSRYKMAGIFGHEYTHHTQMISTLDAIKCINNCEESKLALDMLATLKEGQALKMEEEISKLYSEKENDTRYLRYVLDNKLNSMIKVYNALDSRNKSKAISSSFISNSRYKELLSGDIGTAYFALNNLKSKDYYKEVTTRLVNNLEKLDNCHIFLDFIPKL